MFFPQTCIYTECRISWNSCVHPLILHFALEIVYINYVNPLPVKLRNSTGKLKLLMSFWWVFDGQYLLVSRTGDWERKTGSVAPLELREILVKLSIIPLILARLIELPILPCNDSVNLSKWSFGELFILQIIKGYQMKKTISTLQVLDRISGVRCCTFRFRPSLTC